MVAVTREPPHNFEAEQALLGAILFDNRAYATVAEYLRAEHFADPLHGRLFAGLATMIDRGQIVSPVTINAFVDGDGDMRTAGGHAYIARLLAASVHAANADAFGRQIFEASRRRRLIAIAEAAVSKAYSGDLVDETSDQIADLEREISDLAAGTPNEEGFQPFSVAMEEAVVMAEGAYHKSGAITGVATGLTELDQLLGGLHTSDLIILAGRPSMGKSALATNIAFHAASAGDTVGFFSLEMARAQLAQRIAAEQSALSAERLMRGQINSDGFDRFLSVSDKLMALPLPIDQTTNLTISALRSRARRLARSSGNLRLIVVDYLQLLAGSGTRGRNDNRMQEISEITRGLKGLAKELDIPVLALSQLSREVERRDDKRPQLADLRESGSIEQDADVVMFVFREEYYLTREEPKKRAGETDEKFSARHDAWQKDCERKRGKAEVIVGKQRHGRTGTAHLAFEGSMARFSNLTDQAAEDTGFGF